MKREARVCDCCSASIPDGARSFELRAVLVMRNAHEVEIARTFPDLDSDTCVHAAVSAMIRAAEDAAKEKI